MNKPILLLLLSYGIVIGMEKPESPRGQKRPAAEIIEPVSKEQALESKTPFEKLPNELKVHLLTFLTTARGATKRARLDNAAENIRAFFRTSSPFKYLGDDPQIVNYLITELANRYANGDKVAAAIALGTESAGKWLENIITNQDPELEAEKYEIAQQLSKYFIDAARDGRVNVIKFLLTLTFTNDYYCHWHQPLEEAIKNNQMGVIQLIFASPIFRARLSMFINERDQYGRTLLFYSIDNNNEPLTDMLLAAGANVNIVDENDESPIVFAIGRQNSSIIQKIIAKGVSPIILNSTEVLLLLLAIETALI